jgi:hypothetical protein
MNAPRDLGPDFREWLSDIPSLPPELPARTLEETRHTRQRRRWRWFLPGPKPTAGAKDERDRTRLAEAITTRPIGGTRTMFSATNVAAAVAITALAGALLVAAPLATQDGSQPAAPAADVEAAGVTLVSGVIEGTGQEYAGSTESHDWGYAVRDALKAVEFAVSDERLSGPALLRGNWNRPADDMWTWVATETVYLQNEGGSWTGTGYAYADPPATEGEYGSGTHERLVLEGHDGYEGLTAILDLDSEHMHAPTEVSGAIVPLDLPEMPAAAPTTLE